MDMNFEDWDDLAVEELEKKTGIKGRKLKDFTKEERLREKEAMIRLIREHPVSKEHDDKMLAEIEVIYEDIQ